MRVIKRIISGGQTGADRGALDAAIDLGIPHGGWCPRGRRAEDGVIPAKYTLKETESADYPVRTEQNVRDADGTVVFTIGKPEGGSALTIQLAKRHKKPVLSVDLARTPAQDAGHLLGLWVHDHRIGILNVAGSRESRSPGLGKAVYQVTKLAFQREG